MTTKPGPIELWLDKMIDLVYARGHERLTEALGWLQYRLPKGW